MAALDFPPELLVKAQGSGLAVKLALFSVDGVLTDGRLHVDANGEAMTTFSLQDGQGLALLPQAGITPVLLCRRDSPGLRRLAAHLGVARVLYGVDDTLAAATPLLAECGAQWGEVAAIGSDWPDLPLLSRAGFACAPAGAHAEVRGVAHHVTAAPAGCGAAREFCDLLLMAAGRYERLLHAHHDAPHGDRP
ncbi:KdsC family phosphatase [Roseateles sp. DXS20W]|uniref:KdsC family phosphatase n=1 Tax=Pelomonas lactea TaxID=3299030 RepID=A0ABW7GQU9_9BURK